MRDATNATELLIRATEDVPCITWGVVELCEFLRQRTGWKWNRPGQETRAERMRSQLLFVSREEVMRLNFAAPARTGAKHKEKSNMLTLTGTAQFTNEGRTLEIVTNLQPSTADQHDLLTRFAELNAASGVSMVKGQCVLKRIWAVPPAPPLAPSAPAAEVAVASPVAPSAPVAAAAPSGTAAPATGESSTPETQEIAPSTSGKGQAGGASASAGAPAQAVAQVAKVQIGDLVQWVVEGKNQLAEALKVTGISNDGTQVIVEGMGEFPVDEVAVVTPVAVRIN